MFSLRWIASAKQRASQLAATLALASNTACHAASTQTAAPVRSGNSTPAASSAQALGATLEERDAATRPVSPLLSNARSRDAATNQAEHWADLSLPGPGIAQLRGVNENEVWIAFEAPVDTPPEEGAPSGRRFTHYDAVLSIHDGCVADTYDWSPPYSSEQVKRYIAFLERFPVHYTLGVAMRDRKFMGLAYGANGRFIATETDGLSVSLDGGQSFTALRERRPYSATFVDDKYLVAWAHTDEEPKGPQTLLIYALPDLEHPRHVSIPRGYYVEGTEESKLLFSHYGTRLSERCVSMLDVVTGPLTSRYCMKGPPRAPNTFFAMVRSPNGRFGAYATGDFDQMRINVFDASTGKSLRTISRHVYGMSHSELANDGSYVWQSSIDGLIYAAGERGARVLPAKGEFLGLDMAGRALVFQRPPLIRPHEVGALMPPVNGQLGGYHCRLIRIVDPYSAMMSAIDGKIKPK